MGPILDTLVHCSQTNGLDDAAKVRLAPHALHAPNMEGACSSPRLSKTQNNNTNYHYQSESLWSLGLVALEAITNVCLPINTSPASPWGIVDSRAVDSSLPSLCRSLSVILACTVFHTLYFLFSQRRPCSLLFMRQCPALLSPC